MLQSNALVVDNSAFMRNYVREILHQELGFNEIIEAGDADDAFRVLKSGRAINWIFSSLEMSGQLSPFDLMGVARNNPNSAPPRFVLMSSNDELVTRKIAIREGVADYLCKPFDPSQLVGMVHRLTGLTKRCGTGRLKVHLPCEINIGFDSFHHYGAELADISMAGCLMKTSQVKPGSGYVGDYATVTLLPENEASFHVQAKIKRVEVSKSCADPLRDTEMAIEFVDVASPLKEKLESFINSCKEKPIANRALPSSGH
ncbi:MAG: response regulator [Gallionella sp.]|nr:response regulator [Gallionella sp.]